MRFLSVFLFSLCLVFLFLSSAPGLVYSQSKSAASSAYQLSDHVYTERSQLQNRLTQYYQFSGASTNNPTGSNECLKNEFNLASSVSTAAFDLVQKIYSEYEIINRRVQGLGIEYDRLPEYYLSYQPVSDAISSVNMKVSAEANAAVDATEMSWKNLKNGFRNQLTVQQCRELRAAVANVVKETQKFFDHTQGIMDTITKGMNELAARQPIRKPKPVLPKRVYRINEAELDSADSIASTSSRRQRRSQVTVEVDVE